MQYFKPKNFTANISFDNRKSYNIVYRQLNMGAKNWLNIIIMAALCVSSFIFGCFLQIVIVAYNRNKINRNNFWIVIGTLLFISYLSANYVIVILIREYIKQKFFPSTGEVCQNATETEEIERYIYNYIINIKYTPWYVSTITKTINSIHFSALQNSQNQTSCNGPPPTYIELCELPPPSYEASWQAELFD